MSKTHRPYDPEQQELLRGLEKVNWEWLFICASHNLLKLFRHGPGFPSEDSATADPATAGLPVLPQASSHGLCLHSRIRSLTPCPPTANPRSGSSGTFNHNLYRVSD